MEDDNTPATTDTALESVREDFGDEVAAIYSAAYELTMQGTPQLLCSVKEVINKTLGWHPIAIIAQQRAMNEQIIALLPVYTDDMGAGAHIYDALATSGVELVEDAYKKYAEYQAEQRKDNGNEPH